MSLIRPATPADAPGICAIWNPVIRDTSATFTTAEKSEAGIAQDIRDREGAFFVAERQGQVSGFATYFPFRGGPGYAYTKEHSIMIAPDAQGQGIGRKLMIALESHATEAGIHSLWAGVSGENGAGVAFHARLGYREIARLPEVGFKFGRWMDLILMQKRL